MKASWACLAGLVAALASEPAQGEEPLPSPLRLEQVRELARTQRAEIAAARARARAAAQRPEIVSALDDPEVTPSLDHLPFMLDGANVSLGLEQRFPMSRLLAHRRGAAEAEARRLEAEAQRVGLDVELDAAAAFFMLHERRGMARVLAEQRLLAKQVLTSATARYSTGAGTQADALRAEIDLARLDAALGASTGEVRAAEAMLAVSLGRTPGTPIPALEVAPSTEPPEEVATLVRRSVDERPELRAGRAEISRAEAETQAMGSMALPMGMVRTGPAYTMTEHAGWMLMVGISIPLWRGKVRAGVAEAEAMTDMARADLVAMQRMVEGDAARAREQVIAARERYLALRDEVVPKAQRALEPTLAAYVSGQVPLVSVVEVAQAVWMAKGELVMAEAELGLAWARLERALGNTRESP